MLNVGLTGNAAAGKSTVAEFFSARGAALIDADAIVRDLQEPGSPLLRDLAAAFGPETIKPDGSLDRDRLRSRMLDHAEAREALNRLVHPRVQQYRSRLMAEAAARGETVVINDIPLLFEVMDPNDFDVIVLVDAPPEIRRARLIERGLADAEADALMAAQMDSTLKRDRADFVIDNDGTVEVLLARCEEVWKALTNLAGAQAHTGRA